MHLPMSKAGSRRRKSVPSGNNRSEELAEDFRQHLEEGCHDTEILPTLGQEHETEGNRGVADGRVVTKHGNGCPETITMGETDGDKGDGARPDLGHLRLDSTGPTTVAPQKTKTKVASISERNVRRNFLGPA